MHASCETKLIGKIDGGALDISTSTIQAFMAVSPLCRVRPAAGLPGAATAGQVASRARGQHEPEDQHGPGT